MKRARDPSGIAAQISLCIKLLHVRQLASLAATQRHFHKQARGGGRSNFRDTLLSHTYHNMRARTHSGWVGGKH